MELFLCFEVQVDVGEKKTFWRREGRKSRVYPMWFFGRATMRENSISIPLGVDWDKISMLNKLIMSFFSVILSGWIISGYKKTKSPNSLESLIRGSELFLFGDNSCSHGEDSLVYLIYYMWIFGKQFLQWECDEIHF